MKPLHLLNLNLLCFSMRYNAFNLFSYGKLPKQKRPPRVPSNKMNKKNTSTTYIYGIFFFLFIYLFGCPHGRWKFLGQALNQRHS